MDLFDEQENKKVTGGPITGYSLKVIFPEKEKINFKNFGILLLVLIVISTIGYGGFKSKEIINKKRVEKAAFERQENERQEKMKKALEASVPVENTNISKKTPKTISNFDDKMDKIINGKTKDIYLVFAGGIKDSTEEKIELLKEENINASFFTVGSNIAGKDEVLKKIQNQGHYIGVTGNNEDYLNIYSSVENVAQSVLSSKNTLKNILGDYDAKLALVPGPLLVPRFNTMKEEAKTLLKEKEINTIKYNQYAAIDEEDEDLKDSLANKIDLESTVVLLIYESNYDKVDVLKNIIKKFKDAKYTFKTFYDLEDNESKVNQSINTNIDNRSNNTQNNEERETEIRTNITELR